MTVIDVKDIPTALKKAKEILYPQEPNWEPKTFQDGAELLCKALEITLISKNHKYGKANILDFGEHGIVIRLNDKYQRLKNMIFKNIDGGEETKVDTWGDIAGYGLVGLMNELDLFKLDIKLD